MNSIRNRVYAGEIAFGNQMRVQMDKTSNSISQWFDGARKAASNSAGAINSGSNPK